MPDHDSPDATSASATDARAITDAADALDASSAGVALDPADWDHYRDVGHRMLDELLELLRTVDERPVWTPVPQDVKERLRAPAPRQPQPVEDVWRAIQQLIVPYPTGNIHPRFLGWVHGTGTAGGVLAEMVAATLNCNLGGREHAPVYVERQLLGWCKEIFGFPPEAGGVLVTGTSMANLVALSVARNNRCGEDVRANGVTGGRYVVYASREGHVSVRKALELLGLGARALHVVPVGPDFRMSVQALQRAIAADRARGLVPFCVVGSAGTVNTGAVDDLGAVADVCAAEGLWYHVDGAFGAMAMLSEEHRQLLRGIERADSLAFDFHKWLHAPYAVGCVLVRDGALHRRAFTAEQSYLERHDRGLAGGAPWFCEFGPDLSRGFAALKVWFTIQEHGLDKLGANITRNCAQARYLAQRVEHAGDLELKAPVSLNIVCFRYTQPGLGRGELNRINQEIVYFLHEHGIAAPSTARLGGDLTIRVNITNHRTRYADLDLLVQAVREAGARATLVSVNES